MWKRPQHSFSEQETEEEAFLVSYIVSTQKSEGQMEAQYWVVAIVDRTNLYAFYYNHRGSYQGKVNILPVHIFTRVLWVSDS